MNTIKLLIVEDATFVRNLIKKSIEKKNEISNYKIEIVGEATNGLDAIKKYFDIQPDIVTMDLNMPIMDGIEAIKTIFSKDNNAKIIVITGNTDPKIKEEVINLGISEYIQKPLNDNIFWKTLDKIVKNKEEINSSKKDKDEIDEFLNFDTTNKNNSYIEQVNDKVQNNDIIKENQNIENDNEKEIHIIKEKNTNENIIEKEKIEEENIKNNNISNKMLKIENEFSKGIQSKKDEGIKQKNVINIENKIYNNINESLYPSYIKPPREKILNDIKNLDNINVNSKKFDVDKNNNNINNNQTKTNIITKLKSIFKRG